MKTSILRNPEELRRIGRMIKEARGTRTQQWLAALVGTPTSVISNIERGKRLVPRKRVELFARHLQLKVQDLVPQSVADVQELRSDIKALESDMGIDFRELRALPDEAKMELIEHFRALKERYEKNDGVMCGDDRPSEIAEKVLRKCRLIDQAPIDLFRIAKENSVVIEPSNTIDADGWILYPRDKRWAAIKYKPEMSLGRQRFTIAHELGHFFLKNLDSDERSCFIEGKKDQNERDADEFASSLLMPEGKVKSVIGGKIRGYEDILKIGQMFEVSQQSAAIRLVRLTTVPAAVIYSEAGKIKWGIPSAAMYLRVKKGHRLSALSQARKFLSNRPKGLMKPVEAKAEHWFFGRMKERLQEHSSRLYQDRVLTLIWAR